jgi:hypothetical protein
VALDVRVVGPNGSPWEVNGGEGTGGVVVHPHPPIGEQTAATPYRAYFRDSSASSDMQVSASLTVPQFFEITPSETKDRYIKTVSLIIADAGATLSEWGNTGAALTNGCKLEWSTDDLGVVTVGDDLKTNWDFVRLSLGNPSFGDTTAAFRASNVFNVSEAYIPVLDFSLMFGLPWGLRIRAGSGDKLRFVIQDNTTGVDQFDAIGYGIEI